MKNSSSFIVSPLLRILTMILILSFLGTSVLNHEVKAQRPIKSFFDRVQQIFSNRPPSTSSTTTEYSTLIETEPNTETIDVNYVAADQSEPEISTMVIIATSFVSNTITHFFTPEFSTVELEPETVTVTEWSPLDRPGTTVMSTLTTTLPVETVTETQTEEITVTETTTLVTTAPPETLVLVSTEFTPQMMSNTETVVSTLVETSMITETSTFIFTEILPPIISTATIIETVTVDDIAFTQMGMEDSTLTITKTETLPAITMVETVTAYGATLIKTSVEIERITETLPAVSSSVIPSEIRFTETLPAITSTSTLVQTVAAEPVTITQTGIEKTVTVTLTDQPMAITVTSTFTTVMDSKGQGVNMESGCPFCLMTLSEDQYNLLFEDADIDPEYFFRRRPIIKSAAVLKVPFPDKRKIEIESSL